jgi:hypothetical protein
MLNRHATLTIMRCNEEMLMGYLPNITAPEMADSLSAQRYRSLLDQSACARARGDHLLAQQFATGAHKWAMGEHRRLQRLVHAREALTVATRYLDTAWAKDRACTTVAELRERHPEFKRVISGWELAQQLVSKLDAPPPDDGTAPLTG